MFKKLSMLAIAGAAVLSACNSSTDKTQGADSTKTEQTIGKHEGHGNQAQTNHAGSHTYSCPMHPEVVSDKPGECPKCGMELEHTDGAASAKKFAMGFKVSPEAPKAGQPVELTLKPTDPENAKADVALDVEHEKKIHLIITSKDLAYFDHIHPEYGAEGDYRVKHTFPKDDRYILFADYKPTEGMHTTDKHEVAVGSGREGKTQFTTQRLTTTADGYEVSLVDQSGKTFAVGEQAHIAAIIKQDGKEINAESLENYLGAKAHMVVIRQGTLDYLHVHPGIENGRLDLHTTFEQAGTYRGWLQFQTGGKVHTADFVIIVKPAA